METGEGVLLYSLTPKACSSGRHLKASTQGTSHEGLSVLAWSARSLVAQGWEAGSWSFSWLLCKPASQSLSLDSTNSVKQVCVRKRIWSLLHSIFQNDFLRFHREQANNAMARGVPEARRLNTQERGLQEVTEQPLLPLLYPIPSALPPGPCQITIQINWVILSAKEVENLHVISAASALMDEAEVPKRVWAGKAGSFKLITAYLIYSPP